MSYSVVLPFFEGQDDRETLAFGMRMVEHPGIKLTVLKFIAKLGKSLNGKADVGADDKNKDNEIFFEFINVSNNNESVGHEENNGK